MPNPDPTPEEHAPDAEAAPQVDPESDTPEGEPAASDEARDAGAAANGGQDADVDATEPEGDLGQDEEPLPEPDPLVEAERQRDEYLDLLRRERAEFENFRRRSARERAEALDRGAELLVSQLLGVLDNFGYVLDAAEGSSDESLSKGAQMVHTELLDILERAGLKPVPGAGAPFDPTHHEAMMQVEAIEPVEQPIVAEVLRPGYRFKERVLRPASVSVAQ